MKVWNERVIYTEDQKVTIKPDELQESVILNSSELKSDKSFKLYLSYEETLELAHQLKDFVKHNK